MLDTVPPIPTFTRFAPRDTDIINDHINKLLKLGHIQPAPPGHQPFLTKCFLAHPHNSKRRLVIDYRRLNSCTKRQPCPIPREDDLLSHLSGSTIFTKLDLHSGFHQIRMAPDCIHTPPSEHLQAISNGLSCLLAL